jgi:two-component system response regulator ResD
MAGKVLIADDEYDIRFMLEQLLKLEGFEVSSAANGREALEKLNRDDFDLLILDLMMPEIDGFGVLSELDSARLSRMKVIILSAKATDEDRIRGYSVGAAHYVTKPFDNDSMVDIVRYLVGDLSPQERESIRSRIQDL